MASEQAPQMPHPLLAEFAEAVYKQADTLAAQNEHWTVETVLEAADFLLPTIHARRRTKSVTGYTIALKKLKEDAPEQAKAGGKELKGDYAKYVSRIYQERKEEFRKMAEEANNRIGQEISLISTESLDKQNMRDLKAMVSGIRTSITPAMTTVGLTSLSGHETGNTALPYLYDSLAAQLLRSSTPLHKWTGAYFSRTLAERGMGSKKFRRSLSRSVFDG